MAYAYSAILENIEKKLVDRISFVSRSGCVISARTGTATATGSDGGSRRKVITRNLPAADVQVERARVRSSSSHKTVVGPGPANKIE